jgi:hypothetical protein
VATSSWTDLLRRILRALRPGGAPTRGTKPSARPSAPPSAPRAGRPTGTYPGDYRGVVRAEYAPRPDGAPDPGEVVWTWVPFEEDFSRGKDRPVLLVGRDGAWLLALQLTSKDHDRDAAQEARWGRHWMDVGSGAWDSQGRPSEVRLDRVVRVDAARVRREGAVLPRATFDAVVGGMRRHGH